MNLAANLRTKKGKLQSEVTDFLHGGTNDGAVQRRSGSIMENGKTVTLIFFFVQRFHAKLLLLPTKQLRTTLFKRMTAFTTVFSLKGFRLL